MHTCHLPATLPILSFLFNYRTIQHSSETQPSPWALTPIPVWTVLEPCSSNSSAFVGYPLRPINIQACCYFPYLIQAPYRFHFFQLSLTHFPSFCSKTWKTMYKFTISISSHFLCKSVNILPSSFHWNCSPQVHQWSPCHASNGRFSFQNLLDPGQHGSHFTPFLLSLICWFSLIHWAPNLVLWHLFLQTLLLSSEISSALMTLSFFCKLMIPKSVPALY